MKFYRLGYYEWESHREEFLYNEEKEYTDIEFRELCAEITCEEMYNYWLGNEYYLNNYKNDTNFTKEEARDLWEIKLEEVRFEDIHDKVIERIKEYGFKCLSTDTIFIMNSNHGIMSSETNDENKLVIEKYKLFERKQKLQRLVK